MPEPTTKNPAAGLTLLSFFARLDAPGCVWVAPACMRKRVVLVVTAMRGRAAAGSAAAEVRVCAGVAAFVAVGVRAATAGAAGVAWATPVRVTPPTASVAMSNS